VSIRESISCKLYNALNLSSVDTPFLDLAVAINIRNNGLD
jgi:hypothetical protein